MLARANRVVRPEDFRAIVRRGRRTASTSAVYYRLERADESPARFGFIVARSVGGAVDRNRVRRRMRAVGREIIDAGGRGVDVVVRALPGSAQQGWTSLSAEMHENLDAPLIRR